MFDTLIEITCCNKECHVTFGLSQGHYNKCKADSTRLFYCPNGHSQYFSDSETDKLRRENERLRQNAAYLEERAQNINRRNDELKRSNAAVRGVVTRIKNRVSNGVCPCCNRTFNNLLRHMKHKHPGFKTEDVA